MRKILSLFAIAAMICMSCGSDMEREARALFDEAHAAYEAKDYGKAKVLLDSIKDAYPKAFKTRREALALGRDVAMGEQRRSVEHYDKEIATLAERRDTLLPKFVLEKDSRYQDVGNYMMPSQTLKNNYGVTYLRAQVDETGIAFLTSIYRGKAIKHTTVRVTSEGSYAECDTPVDRYTSKHQGVTTERLNFKYGNDGGIMDFIAASAGESVQVELKGSGKGTYRYMLRRADAEAVVAVLELATVLKAMNELEEMRSEATRHMEFLERSQERFQNR